MQLPYVDHNLTHVPGQLKDTNRRVICPGADVQNALPPWKWKSSLKSSDGGKKYIESNMDP